MSRKRSLSELLTQNLDPKDYSDLTPGLINDVLKELWSINAKEQTLMNPGIQVPEFVIFEQTGSESSTAFAKHVAEFIRIQAETNKYCYTDWKHHIDETGRHTWAVVIHVTDMSAPPFHNVVDELSPDDAEELA